MKNNKYAWIFFIGLIISTFTVYKDTHLYGMAFFFSIIISICLVLILKTIDFIVKKVPFLTILFKLIDRYSKMKSRNIFIEEPKEIIIDTSQIKYVNIQHYKSLKKTYENIVETIKLDELPLIKIVPKTKNYYSAFGNDGKSYICINEEEFNGGYANFILGHEISHHHYRDFTDSLQILFYTLVLTIAIAMLSNPYLFLAFGALIPLTSFIYIQYKSRKSEYRADLLGKYFSSSAEGLKFFNDYKEDSFVELISTHPSFKNRITNLLNKNIKLEKKEKDIYEEEFVFMNIIMENINNKEL